MHNSSFESQDIYLPTIYFIRCLVSNSRANRISGQLDACRKFEEEFHLVWNQTLGVYLTNETANGPLLAQNPNVSFTFGNDLTSGSHVTIDIPYRALVLNLTEDYPNVANATSYVPLRRASNSSQYTLGRAFLQHAYLIADYERSNFSVSQVVFSDENQKRLRGITSPSDNSTSITPTSSAAPAGSSGLSSGALAGVIVGVVVGTATVVVGVLAFLRHTKRKQKLKPEAAVLPDEKPEIDTNELGLGKWSRAEIDGLQKSVSELSPHPFSPSSPDTGELTSELSGKGMLAEAPGEWEGNEVGLHTPVILHELEGSETFKASPHS